MSKYIVIMGTLHIGQVEFEADSPADAKAQAGKLLEQQEEPAQFMEKLATQGMGMMLGVMNVETGDFFANPMVSNMGDALKDMVKMDSKPSDPSPEPPQEDNFNPFDPQTY